MPKGKSSFKSALLVIWLIFSVLYVGYDAAVYLTAKTIQGAQERIAQQSYAKGRTDAVSQVIGEATKCKPFPVNVGETTVNLISVECLQQAAQKQAGAANAAPAEQPAE